MQRDLYGFVKIAAVAMILGLTTGIALAGPCELPTFHAKDFKNPALINNPYFPLVPGTTFIYEPVPNEDNVVNTIEVTDEVKNILGIDCVVVHDFETEDGELKEDTYDWYAQDKYGNIWYFGEDTTEYLDDGTISTEGSWEAGVDGALPGYLILSNPHVGECYQQEEAEDAKDEARVLRLNRKVTLETTGEVFEDCLVTKEWSPLDPGNVEHKSYYPGRGLVLIEELKEKSLRVELVSDY